MDNLIKFIEDNFENYISIDDNKKKIHALNELQALALYRVLDNEMRNQLIPRDCNIDDLYHFDNNLKQILSEVLHSKTPINQVFESNDISIFNRDRVNENRELTELKLNGYKTSSNFVDDGLIDEIKIQLSDLKFVNRGIFNQEFYGYEIFNKIKGERSFVKRELNGDTFWIKDMSELVKRDIFQKIAFDPYILSIVSGYLGCCPIHVGTNVWFSFPTLKAKSNLDVNAQLFHQDKEFIKFIKVFIYLSDVSGENGPHCYVEGSHLREAYTFGIPFSERISDEDVQRYYGDNKIKVILGEKGTMVFADTSSVHKGFPVEKGYRLMLQLEYASSLYLSPICPFSSLENFEFLDKKYSEDIVKRLTKNYNDSGRQLFTQSQLLFKSSRLASLVKLMRLAKRYLFRIFEK